MQDARLPVKVYQELGVALPNGPTSVSSSPYSSHVNTEADPTYEQLLLFWSESYKV
jgi:hypothetical protein